MRLISAALGRLARRPVPVIVALAVLGAAGWAVAQPPLQLAANCVGGGSGGGGTGGYGAPTTTCGPYVPLTPTRVLDTRTGIGSSAGPIGPGQTLTLTVAGANGVPAMPGASAVVLNVTAVVPTQGSFLTVWPDGQPQPTASNLNFVASETVANLVEVQLGTTGAVDFFNPFGSVQVVADLEGYVATSATGSAGLFNPMAGVRVLDTRTGTGVPHPGPVGPSSTINVPVTGGTTGVPATGVSAVVFNLTVTQPTAPSDVTAFPDSTSRPTASNINFGAGETIANRVIVPVVNGYVSLYNVQGDVQLIADINGYFTNSSVPANSGSDFNAEAPVRIVDTRPNSGIPYSGATLQPNGTLLVQVAGSAGVPLMSSTAPPTAVVLNLTEASANAPSFLTVYPSDVSRPGISDDNFVSGQVQPNLVVVKLSSLGQLSFYNAQGMTNIVVDVEGWYS